MFGKNAHRCISMCAIGKQFGCKVIMHSSDAADHFSKYFEHGADVVVIGEGEQTLFELLELYRVEIQKRIFL